MNIAKEVIKGVMTLQDLDGLLLEAGEIIDGEIEIFEGTVKWVKRIVKYTKWDIEEVENYEFIDINRDNIDIDNPPEYLEKYLEYIFHLEMLTIGLNN